MSVILFFMQHTAHPCALFVHLMGRLLLSDGFLPCRKNALLMDLKQQRLFALFKLK